MYINPISKNTFEGKIKFDKNLSESKKDFVNKVLDYKKDGQTLRNRISRANFDIIVDSMDADSAIHPKVYFYSRFKKLRSPNHYENPEKYTYFSEDLKIDSTIKNGAKHLEKFLNEFEKRKRNYFYIDSPEGKVKETLRRFFGIK